MHTHRHHLHGWWLFSLSLYYFITMWLICLCRLATLNNKRTNQPTNEERNWIYFYWVTGKKRNQQHLHRHKIYHVVNIQFSVGEWNICGEKKLDKQWENAWTMALSTGSRLSDPARVHVEFLLLAIFSLLAHHCMRSAFASFCALNCFESDLNLFISTKRGIYGICMLFWLYSFIHSRAFIFIVQR